MPLVLLLMITLAAIGLGLSRIGLLYHPFPYDASSSDQALWLVVQIVCLSPYFLPLLVYALIPLRRRVKYRDSIVPGIFLTLGTVWVYGFAGTV
jgi:hypothetical protein